MLKTVFEPESFLRFPAPSIVPAYLPIYIDPIPPISNFTFEERIMFALSPDVHISVDLLCPTIPPIALDA